jgi:hypothetical protein
MIVSPRGQAIYEKVECSDCVTGIPSRVFKVYVERDLAVYDERLEDGEDNARSDDDDDEARPRDDDDDEDAARGDDDNGSAM